MHKNIFIGGALYHYGVKGQKWGVRNGPPYPVSSSKKSVMKNIPKDVIFISGSSKTQDKTSPYYRKSLNKKLKSDIDKEIKKNNTIIVGDAPGIDRQVQNYLRKKNYKNVEVYSPGKKARYLANKKWKNVKVDAPEYEEMSPEWLSKKDIEMSKKATKGIAVILPNGGAGATRNNIDRLLKDNKDVKIYQIGEDKIRDGEIFVEDYLKERRK